LHALWQALYKFEQKVWLPFWRMLDCFEGVVEWEGEGS
jgi:hypothetical protein